MDSAALAARRFPGNSKVLKLNAPAGASGEKQPIVFLDFVYHAGSSYPAQNSPVCTSPMPTLSSLLVQREVASMRTVEEAIARQVLRGGDLATNVLELGVVDEAMLVYCLAESLGLLPAPVGALRPDDPSLLRLVPAELAFRHGIFPLSLEGSVLHIVVSEPLPQEVEEELSFGLNLSLKPYAAPLVRIRQAIAACYGIPLDRRMMRLVAKMEGKPDPSPTIAPPAPSESGVLSAMPMLPHVSIPPPTFGTGLPPTSHDLSFGAEEEGQGEVSSEMPPIPPVPAIPRLPSMEGRSLTPGGTPAAIERTPEPPFADGQADRETAEEPERRERMSKGGLLNWVRRKAIQEKGRAAPELIESKGSKLRFKGPFTAARAEEEMEAAQSPDAVLNVFFTFAKQYFEFSFLFVVQSEVAEGRDVWGPGASLIDAHAVGIPLSLPSTFSLVKKRRAPLVTPLSEEGIDADFTRDVRGISQDGSVSPVAALVPLVVRGRVVAILYGDDGPQPVDLSAIGDVIAMTALSASALERLILRRKLNAFRSADAAPPDSQAHKFGGLAGPPSGTGARTVPESERRSAAVRAQIPMPKASKRGASQPEIEVGWDVLPADLVPPARDTLPALSMPGEVIFDEGDTFAGLGAEQAYMPSEPAPKPAAPPGVIVEPHGAPPLARRRTMTPPIPREEPDAEPAPREEVTGPVPDFLENRAFLEPQPASANGAAVGRIKLNAILVPASSRRPEISEKTAATPPDAAALLTKAEEGGPSGEWALSELVRMGEGAIAALMAQFPGKLSADQKRAREQMLPASKCSVLLSALIGIGRPALSPVCARSSSSDAEARFWAVHTLSEIPYIEAANAIVPRLFDDDAGVRRIARRAAGKLIELGSISAPIVQGLGTITRNIDEPVRRRVFAIEAIGEIQARILIPPLISALSDPIDDVSEAARRALIGITRQDFGVDAGSWTEWWSISGQCDRIEWLIDAFSHGSPILRRAAADDLLELTGEYVGFHEEMNPEELERAAGVYRAWWEKQKK